MKNSENSWFNNWPDGLIGISKRSAIVQISPMAQSIIGWSTKDAFGTNLHTLLCQDDEHDVAECDLTKEGVFNKTSSTMWKHKNGHPISVDFRIIPVGYDEATRIVSFVDNSNRLHNQAEMEKFSEYVQMSPAPLAEFVMDGQLLFGNAALQDLLFEYGFDENGDACAIPADITRIGKRLLDNGNTDEIVETIIADKVYVWHFHLLTSNNKPTVVGYALDITGQRLAEEAAEEQRSQARKEFYAKMVHELRSPLNAIVGFSDILIDSLESEISTGDLKKLKLIKDAGIQLNEQVTDTLDVAKIESGKMSLEISEFTIEDICEEVFEQMNSLASEKLLNFQYFCRTKEKIFSDRTKVRQILINLLSNAIKYTQEGDVNLLAEVKQDINQQNCICFLVSDTGIGIPEEQMSKLFKSFEQIDEYANREIEGTGLGLSLVDNLTTLLGGKIELSSSYGIGTTFEVWLPFMSSTGRDELR